jgi:hypothetical protein
MAISKISKRFARIVTVAAVGLAASILLAACTTLWKRVPHCNERLEQEKALGSTILGAMPSAKGSIVTQWVSADKKEFRVIAFVVEAELGDVKEAFKGEKYELSDTCHGNSEEEIYTIFYYTKPIDTAEQGQPTKSATNN